MNAKRSLREIGKLREQMFEQINSVKFLGFLFGKNANLTQVVDICAIERPLCESGATGTNPSSLPFNRPTITFIPMEMNVSFIDINQ
jgi:hypothetical protein